MKKPLLFAAALALSSVALSQVVTPPMDKLAFEQGKPFPLPFEMPALTSFEVGYGHPVQHTPSPLEQAAGQPTVETHNVVFQLKEPREAVPDVLKEKVGSCDVLTEQVPGSEMTPARVFFRTVSLACADRQGKLIADARIEGFIAAKSDSRNGLPKADLQTGTRALVIVSKGAKLYPANLLVGAK